MWRPQTAPFGFWILDFGFWFLDFGFRILDFGLLPTVWILHKISTSHADSGRRISWPRSIAQGSGGNFKKRKPVGEVGCCESRHFPVSSLSVSFLRFLWLSIYQFIYLSIYVSSHLSTDQSFKLPSYLATYLSTVSSYLSIYLSSHLFIYSYQDLALCLLICLSIYPSIHRSIHLSIFRYLSLQKWSEILILSTFWLWNVLRVTTVFLFQHLSHQKWQRPSCYQLLPQQCAIFRHLSRQNWSEPGVFCAFWLGNVFRATTACHIVFLIRPDGSA